jgi:hypothetical protein
MTTAGTDHDIEPYVLSGSGKATARCLTHQTDTREQWHDLAAAGRGFVCDEGRALRFIIETATGADGIASVPVMRDLSGLARMVRAAIEAHAYTNDDMLTAAWLWLGRARVEALNITLDTVRPERLLRRDVEGNRGGRPPHRPGPRPYRRPGLMA